MNIILTGATGTLGSRILYELLELQERPKIIYLYVRAKKSLTPLQRIFAVLSSEFAPSSIQNDPEKYLKNIVVLDAQQLLDPPTYLKNHCNTYFIHAAGYVNLSTHDKSKEEVFRENHFFTKKIFTNFSDTIDKFIYISTAFSIGNSEGILKDDYHKIQPDSYRNHYEEAKHLTEKFLVNEGKKADIAIQILRPSVLGGNIMDTPTYFISKYMVFYLFAKFFFNTNSKDAIRISIDKTTTLNVIPTDYAAKVIVKVFQTNIQQLNIVNKKGTDVSIGMSNILDTVGFKNYNLTDKAIKNSDYKSKLEQFYYETIGVHLNPYLCSKPLVWDTSLLESILPIPRYNLDDYITKTIEFAKTRNFKNERW